MIRVAGVGVVGVILGTLAPIPIRAISPQEEVQAVLASDKALWRDEAPTMAIEILAYSRQHCATQIIGGL